MKLTAADIKAYAYEAGFDLCGVVKTRNFPEVTASVREWTSCNYHADMDWITRNTALRADASLFFEGARTVIVCGLGYLCREQPFGISKYALGDDYHTVVKKKLRELHAVLQQKCGRTIQARAFTDSAPVAEKAYAVEAGLGWIGRNSLLVNREYGSCFFLGELITDLEPEDCDSPDPFNGCGTCRRCVDACPGGAIVSPARIDARRCASYLTIEHRGAFSCDQARIVARSGLFFGCDRCQDVCPYNAKALRKLTDRRNAAVRAVYSADSYDFPRDFRTWLNMSEAAFKGSFSRTPLQRAGLGQLKRNILHGFPEPDTEEPML